MNASNFYRRALATSLLVTGLVSTTAFAQSESVGGTLFQGKCAACHQAQGQGIDGAFPALSNNKLVQGDTMALAGVVLRGRGGMPSFQASLNDVEVASILTFIRSHWGNQADSVASAEIANLRLSVAAKENVDRAQSSTQY